MQKPSVALVSGFWGQNIGNAFFNIGGHWLLRQVFGEEAVAFIQDQPGYRTFHKQHRGNPRNDVGLLGYLDVEYVVLQGPMLTTSFEALWSDTFSRMRARGTKIILLSAGLFRYTDEEKEAVRRFLKKFPPYLISTRDEVTYEFVRDLCDCTYSGIDSAFFAPKAYEPISLTLPPYIAVNFDQYPEPNISVAKSAGDVDSRSQHRFEALGLHWGLRQPKIPMAFANSGQWQTYLGSMIDFRRLPNELAGYQVVRPDHRFNPHITWKVYKQANSIASDEPFTYFTVYANTELTLSDRVHACVATLAYGKPAMLFTPSPRSYLFDRLGVGGLRKRPVTLDLEMLEQERQNELAFLQNAVGMSAAVRSTVNQ